MQFLGIPLEKLREESLYGVVIDLGIRVKEIKRYINEALPGYLSPIFDEGQITSDSRYPTRMMHHHPQRLAFALACW